MDRTKPITDASLIQAICTKCATCYGALAFCRGLSGSDETDEWWLCRNHTIEQLLAEADQRGLDLMSSVSAVDRQPLTESMRYRRARGLVGDVEYRRYGRDLSAGRIDIDGSPLR
jgi:hypothetical protein